MKNIFVKSLETFHREGIKSVIRKTLRRYNAWNLTRKTDFAREKIRWNEIKGLYKGQEVFLIGNGPSLNKTPLYLLKDKHKMCFNRFSIMLERLNWYPDFFLTADDLVLTDMLDELDAIVPTTKFSFFPGIHFRGHNYMDATSKYDNAYRTIQKVKRGFSEQLPLIYPGGTVIYEGFQILKHLGFKTVYMVGVDMNYQIHKTAKAVIKGTSDIVSQQDDDPNHFDPRYFGKNRKYHQPESYVIEGILTSMKYLLDEVVTDDFRIINAGYDSALTGFDQQSIDKVVGLTEDEKSELFNDLLRDVFHRTGHDFLDIQDFDIIQNIDDQKGVSKHFACNLKLALTIIPTCIFSHIPVGPFENNYFFVQRKID